MKKQNASKKKGGLKMKYEAWSVEYCCYVYTDNLEQAAREWARGETEQPRDAFTGNLVSTKHLYRALGWNAPISKRALRKKRA